MDEEPAQLVALGAAEVQDLGEMAERRVGDSPGSGLTLELVEARQDVVGVQLRRWPLSEPCCLVAFVVDLREAADLAAVCLGLEPVEKVVTQWDSGDG